MKRILLIACLLISLPAWAVTHPDEKLRDPALEARALAITRELRCVVCQNESVEDSDADIARDLRIDVRKRLLAGENDASIIITMTQRYGDYVLLKPPVDSRTYLLWAMPVIILVAGAWLAATSFRYTRRRKKS